jgi:hypothetical protein
MEIDEISGLTDEAEARDYLMKYRKEWLESLKESLFHKTHIF